MAVLGAQLVTTLVMISIIQKLGPHYSFGRWLLCSTGLMRYLYPTDGTLKQLANISNKGKQKRGTKSQLNGNNGETFHIPRNLEVELETAKVTYLDLVHLRFYTEYQWLIDFSIYALLVYVITEVYQAWFPIKDEINLSMIWCTLVILFALKLLFSLMVQYFRGEESVGERSTCIVMGFIYLLISMIVLIVDERTLELGLENAYSSFNQSATDFLSKQGLSSTGPASKIVLKFFLAVWCGLLGAVFTFPGMRIAKMHWDLLKYFRDNRLKQILLNLTFALPFVLVVLWVRPVTRDYLTTRIFSGRTEPLMTEHVFDTVRLIAIIFTMALKIILMPWYLQAYLDMAYHRTEEQKKEAGRITNREFQKKVAAVFYYLCVVSLQYVAPIILCLYFSLMYKTLGEFSWKGTLREPLGLDECPVIQQSSHNIDPFNTSSETEHTIAQTAEHFHVTLDGLKSIFTTHVFRGLLGFSTWWCCFLYFSTTSVGLIYQSYFTESF